MLIICSPLISVQRPQFLQGLQSARSNTNIASLRLEVCVIFFSLKFKGYAYLSNKHKTKKSLSSFHWSSFHGFVGCKCPQFGAISRAFLVS